jgi:hypothetical protein
MSIYRGVICDHCPQFEKTCKVVLKSPKGVVVLLNEDCEDLKYLEEESRLNLAAKPKLRKGGDLRNGSTHLQPA